MKKFANPFFGVGVDVAPHRYEIWHYSQELAEIARIFKKEFAKIADEQPPEDEESDDSPDEDKGGRKTLSAQRSQALGAASKRLSRGIALRFILECKAAGFPMTVHLATWLLADLFAGYGRSGISESMLVEFAGGGPEARRNAKLDLGEVRGKIIDSGLIKKHRHLLKTSKNEAEAIRAAKRG